MSTNGDDCHVCGACWWVGCPNDADYSMDVTLKRHGLIAFDGKVDLCAGHAKYADVTLTMNISWVAIEQALARQAS